MEEWDRKENPPEEPAARRPRTPAVLMVTVIGGTAVLLALLRFLVLKPPAAEAEPPASQGAVSGTQQEEPAGAILCILGEWEGKLAVFAPNGISPQEVYDVYISTLPEEEQQKLEQGIPVYDEGTLAGLLEDYTS